MQLPDLTWILDADMDMILLLLALLGLSLAVGDLITARIKARKNNRDLDN